MRLQHVAQARVDANDAATLSCLWLARNQTPTNIGHSLLNRDRATAEVEVAHAQRCDLACTQPGVRREANEDAEVRTLDSEGKVLACRWAVADHLRENFNLLVREKRHLPRWDLRKLDVA